MRENAIRALVRQKKIVIEHIPGILNLLDLFTKEMRDTTHFLTLVNLIMYTPTLPESDTHTNNILPLVPDHTVAIGGASTTVEIPTVPTTYSVPT